MHGNIRRQLFVCIGFVISIVTASPASAQVAPAESVVNAVGGWDLVEVRNTSDEVMGFWGIPRIEVAVGNIRRLWFEALPQDEWAIWAFEPVGIYEKISELSGDGARSESIAFLLYHERVAAGSATDLEIDGGAKGPVIKGFIAGDPLTEAISALADPDPVIDLLADVGYPIAPSMTGMMAIGTGGSGMNMSPATKELLNCLRGINSNCHGDECVCVQTETMMTAEPWTVNQTHMQDGRLRCDYSRIEHHHYWQRGLYPEDCTDCTAGTPQDPIPYDVDVQTTEYWLDIENCNDDPLGY